MKEDGQIRLADFGSAIKLSQLEDGTFSNEGFSRWYKSPEMLFGSRNYKQGQKYNNFIFKILNYANLYFIKKEIKFI